MRCDEVKYYVKDFAQGYLIDEMRKLIADHLESCASCRRELETIITENAIAKRYRNDSHSNGDDSARYMMNNNFEFRGGEDNNMAWENGKNKGAENNEYVKNNTPGELSGERSKWLVLFGMIMVLLVTSLIVVMYFYRQPGLYWTVEKIDGAPKVGGKALKEYGQLNKGEWLTTNDVSRALLKVGTIGQIDVNSRSKIKLLDAESSNNRIYIKEGSIQTTIWSNPKVFFVQTPSGTITDRGGIFSLSVDKNGADILHVSSGRAGMQYEGSTYFVPAGAACECSTSRGPGIPYFEDTSPGFINAVHKFDHDTKDTSAENSVVRLSSKRDLLSLWYLLKRSDSSDRGSIYDRINKLNPVSSDITRSGIVSGNKTMMKNLLNDIGYDVY